MPDSRGFEISDPREDDQFTRGKNYLLAIGIDAYEHCSPLENAVLDAKAFVEVLIDQYGFLEENVIALYDEAATRVAIIDAFKSSFKEDEPAGQCGYVLCRAWAI